MRKKTIMILILSILFSIQLYSQMGMTYNQIIEKVEPIIVNKTDTAITTVDYNSLRCTYYFQDNICVQLTILNPGVKTNVYKETLDNLEKLTYHEPGLFWWKLNLSNDKLSIHLIRITIEHTKGNIAYINMILHKTIPL